MSKAKVLYFTVFILVAFAFVFHITAMGFHHWKEAHEKNPVTGTVSYLSFGLFTRCLETNVTKGQSCAPNLFTEPGCSNAICLYKVSNESCSCDYLPSSKGIAACAIIAAIFLGLALILLFLQSINDSNESRIVAILFGFIPLFLLLLTWIFILITLILVGSYLSRDVMFLIRTLTLSKSSFEI